MPEPLDFLAIVSRPDFPSGDGPIGDNYGLRRLLEAHPEWTAAIVELNSRTTDVEWDGGRLVISQTGERPFVVDDVRTALFLPICLEIEETLLHRVDPAQQWPRFATEQWRPISAFVEARLDSINTLNKPSAVRATNNKLIQHEALRRAGFTLPRTRLLQRFPGDAATLVAKNVSEGGWKSADVFSPARLATADDPRDPWPVLWQEPIHATRELRVYVMGDDVVTVELARDPDVLDVRETNDGKPRAQIISTDPAHEATLRAMTRTLGLDYAVIDALPVGDALHVLEVNANGVWWFLPSDVGDELEQRMHTWLSGVIEDTRR